MSSCVSNPVGGSWGVNMFNLTGCLHRPTTRALTRPTHRRSSPCRWRAALRSSTRGRMYVRAFLSRFDDTRETKGPKTRANCLERTVFGGTGIGIRHFGPVPFHRPTDLLTIHHHYLRFAFRSVPSTALAAHQQPHLWAPERPLHQNKTGREVCDQREADRQVCGGAWGQGMCVHNKFYFRCIYACEHTRTDGSTSNVTIHPSPTHYTNRCRPPTSRRGCASGWTAPSTPSR